MTESPSKPKGKKISHLKLRQQTSIFKMINSKNYFIIIATTVVLGVIGCTFKNSNISSEQLFSLPGWKSSYFINLCNLF